MAKILTRCPVCEAALKVTELTCLRCKTQVRSAFDTCRFCRLAPEHLAFIELFLRCEGNLSRVEKQLGLSYPTVRNKLSAALNALGFSPNSDSNADSSPELSEENDTDPELRQQRRNILEALAGGDINAEEAAELLRGRH